MKTWSRARTFAIGIGLIVLTNAVALGGVWWNRSPPADSTLHLSERELSLPWRSLRTGENSGLALDLRWRVVDRDTGELLSAFPYNGGSPAWLDGARMAALGFQVGDLQSDEGRRRYLRQLPRQAILVLELDGPAWQRALAAARDHAERHGAAAEVNAGSKEFAERAKRAKEALAREEHSNSRLFVVDAGTDARQLRQKYPDRTRFMLLNGTIRPFLRDHQREPTQPGGRITRMDIGKLHVPHGLRDAFEALEAPERGELAGQNRFGATVSVGQRLEPWIVYVEPVSKVVR
jgi:hypothetical protein